METRDAEVGIGVRAPGAPSHGDELSVRLADEVAHTAGCDRDSVSGDAERAVEGAAGRVANEPRAPADDHLSVGLRDDSAPGPAVDLRRADQHPVCVEARVEVPIGVVDGDVDDAWTADPAAVAERGIEAAVRLVARQGDAAACASCRHDPAVGLESNRERRARGRPKAGGDLAAGSKRLIQRAAPRVPREGEGVVGGTSLVAVADNDDLAVRLDGDVVDAVDPAEVRDHLSSTAEGRVECAGLRSVSRRADEQGKTCAEAEERADQGLGGHARISIAVASRR